MSNLKAAFGSLFNATAAAGNAATGAINAASNAIDMLNSTVNTAATKQRMEHKAELKNHAARVIIDSTIERSNLVIKGEEYKEKSARHSELFDKYFAELEEEFKTI